MVNHFSPAKTNLSFLAHNALSERASKQSAQSLNKGETPLLRGTGLINQIQYQKVLLILKKGRSRAGRDSNSRRQIRSLTFTGWTTAAHCPLEFFGQTVLKTVNDRQPSEIM
ncbi:unnamed protein product [Laminaria digitata]